MAIKLADVRTWTRIPAGQSIWLPAQNGNAGARRVRIEINAPVPTRIDIDRNMNPPFFLAVVHGFETIEFVDEGDVKLLLTTDEDTWVYTIDGEPMAFEPDGESYTGPMNRQARNPDLEMMQFVMRQNEAKRDAQLEQDRELYRRAMRKAGFDPETGEALEAENGDGPRAGSPGAPEGAPDSGGTGEESGSDGDGEPARPDGAGTGAGAGDEPVKRPKSDDKSPVPAKPKA